MRVEEFSGLFETEKFVFGSGLLVKRGERNARGERGERGERGGERERSERGGRRERERGGRRERERLASTGLIGEKYDAKSKERERERLKDGFEQVVRKHKGGNPVSVVRKLDPKKVCLLFSFSLGDGDADWEKKRHWQDRIHHLVIVFI